MVPDTKDSVGYTIYNIDNLPIAVYLQNSELYSYAYDVDGDRVWKVPSSGTAAYYVNGLSDITEGVQKGASDSS